MYKYIFARWYKHLRLYHHIRFKHASKLDDTHFYGHIFWWGFFHEAHQIGWQIAFLESLIEHQTKAFPSEEEKYEKQKRKPHFRTFIFKYATNEIASYHFHGYLNSILQVKRLY